MLGTSYCYRGVRFDTFESALCVELLFERMPDIHMMLSLVSCGFVECPTDSKRWLRAYERSLNLLMSEVEVHDMATREINALLEHYMSKE